jgi:uncharacterized pyridoxal phosphate-dependent enzyme
MAGDLLRDLGIRRVVNARGPMTLSGAAAMPREAVEAMAEVAGRYVLVDELRAKVDAVVAEVTGAEAGLVTSGAAAGIAASIAACMTGPSRAHAWRLPDTTGLRSEVIVQAGHMVTYVRQVRMTGAQIVVVGAVYPVTAEEIEAAIGPRTAAIFHVISHHCQQKGTVPLDDVVRIGRAHGVPVVVDAAAEIDLRRHVATGADLVIYSGGKAVPGPSASGFVCGRRELIAAAALQFDGICRPMKVGKETLVGLLVALRAYEGRDADKVWAEWTGKCERLVDLLGTLPHADVRVRRDWGYQLDPAGRPLPRVEIWIDEPAMGVRARDVSRVLRAQDPAILLRDYCADTGVLHIDVTCLADDEVDLVAAQVRTALSAGGGEKP